MKKIIILISVLFTISLAGVLYGTQGKQEVGPKYRVIRLSSDGIQPSTVSISVGTVIIWVNESHEMVDIQLAKTEKISFTELESICLFHEGEFNYVVKSESGELLGKIIVQS